MPRSRSRQAPARRTGRSDGQAALGTSLATCEGRRRDAVPRGGAAAFRLRPWRAAVGAVVGAVVALLSAGCGGAPSARGPAPEPAPRVFVLRAEHLARARTLVRAGDPRLRPAYDALLADARAALAVPRFSVVDKSRTPPSGDRHDYMSIGPYWWPDSTRPDGLPWIRRDGQVNPESRRGMDALRLYAFVDAVESLALAYHFTDDEAYATKAAALLRAWFLDPSTRMNPNLRFAQSIPGVSAGRGIGIIDTRDLARIVDVVGLLRRSPAWTDTDQAGLGAWARTFLDWLVTSENGKDEQDEENNHGVWYDAQVAPLALFVGDTALARRVVAGDAVRRLGAQVAATGELPHETARTRPLHYTLFTIEPFQRLAEVGRHVGVDLWTREAPAGGSLRKALHFVAPYADSARPFPKRDVSPVDPGLFVLVLRRGAAALDDPALAAALAKLPPAVVAAHRSRLLYPDAP